MSLQVRGMDHHICTCGCCCFHSTCISRRKSSCSMGGACSVNHVDGHPLTVAFPTTASDPIHFATRHVVRLDGLTMHSIDRQSKITFDFSSFHVFLEAIHVQDHHQHRHCRKQGGHGGQPSRPRDLRTPISACGRHQIPCTQAFPYFQTFPADIRERMQRHARFFAASSARSDRRFASAVEGYRSPLRSRPHFNRYLSAVDRDLWPPGLEGPEVENGRHERPLMDRLFSRHIETGTAHYSRSFGSRAGHPRVSQRPKGLGTHPTRFKSCPSAQRIYQILKGNLCGTRIEEAASFRPLVP